MLLHPTLIPAFCKPRLGKCVWIAPQQPPLPHLDIDFEGFHRPFWWSRHKVHRPCTVTPCFQHVFLLGHSQRHNRPTPSSGGSLRSAGLLNWQLVTVEAESTLWSSLQYSVLHFVQMLRNSRGLLGPIGKIVYVKTGKMGFVGPLQGSRVAGEDAYIGPDSSALIGERVSFDVVPQPEVRPGQGGIGVCRVVCINRDNTRKPLSHARRLVQMPVSVVFTTCALGPVWHGQCPCLRT